MSKLTSKDARSMVLGGKGRGQIVAPIWLGGGAIFLSFFPYPAIFSFSGVGVQLAQVLVLALFLFAFRDVSRTSSFWAFVLLVVPLFVSFSFATLLGFVVDVEIARNVYLITVFTLLCLPVFGWVFRGRTIGDIVPFASAALFVNAAVVGYQYVSFKSGIFPFPDFFNNPSFPNPATSTENYAGWVSRPMGVFPEPSAMSAAIGPWSMLLFYYGLTTRTRRRWTAISAGSLGLVSVLLSKSVYGIPLLIGFGLLIILSVRGARVAIFPVILVGLGAVFAIPYLSLDELVARASLSENASAASRLDSIISGIQLPLDGPGLMLFGYGPGQAGLLFQQLELPYVAIWSILFRWWVDGGLVASFGFLAVTIWAFRSASSVELRLVVALWLVGVGITTSYVGILPIWLLLAFILDGRYGSREEES